MENETPRSQVARASAEQALIRVVHHYGSKPEFVVLGGLVPRFLCVGTDFQHAGTNDVDVQVNLEILCGAVNTPRLEKALRNSEFEPDGERNWRWRTGDGSVVKFELLADLDDALAGADISFDGCDHLGAVNLQGTRFASRDFQVRTLSTRVGGVDFQAEINVAGLAGFLLSKSAAAHSRRLEKDWYDIAFVLLHNDAGGVEDAARSVIENFGSELQSVRTVLDDLRDNFADLEAQGGRAYAGQMILDHPELSYDLLLAEAVTAVLKFHQLLYPD